MAFSICFGMLIGMAAYVAMGGEHYAMMLAITGCAALIGCLIGYRIG